MAGDNSSKPKWQFRFTDRHWLALGVSGLLLRWFLLLNTLGSNDILSWQMFGAFVRYHGLSETYLRLPLFNHPPLMGLWGALAATLAPDSLMAFARWFKVPSVAAEIVTGWLVWKTWQARKPELAARAFAAYGLSLSCILISGYHGNTDAMYFCLALGSVFALEIARRPFLAGLLLGGALNVKLIPVLLVLPLATRCRTWSELRSYALGGLVAGIPFILALALFPSAQRSSFIAHVFQYKSVVEPWGVELFWRGLAAATFHLDSALQFIGHSRYWYTENGGLVLLAASVLLSVWQLKNQRRFDGFELWALMASAFLLFGSGFGVQYVGCVSAALLVVQLRGGVWASTLTGFFILLIYMRFMAQWFPAASKHYPQTLDFAAFAMLAWVSIAIPAWLILRKGWRGEVARVG